MKVRFLPCFLLVSCVTVPPPLPEAITANAHCNQYLVEDDLERAEVQCDLGVEYSPQYGDLWVNKGLIEMRRGHTAKAKEHFIRALRLNENQHQAYTNLGYIALQAKDYATARDNFVRALRVSPTDWDARYDLGLTYAAMRDTQQARKQFRTLVEVNGLLANPHLELAKLALADNKLEEAVMESTVAVRLDPRFEEAWLFLGNVDMEAGQAYAAKDAYDSCLEVAPQSIECRNNIRIAVTRCALEKQAIPTRQDWPTSPDSLLGAFPQGLE